MSDTRRNARHAKSPGDVLGTMGKRIQVPCVPAVPVGVVGAAPQVLRAAGLPLLTAALVTTGNAPAAAVTPRGSTVTTSAAPRTTLLGAFTTTPPTTTRGAAAAPRAAGAPATAPGTAEASAPVTYRVRPGDTVGDIALRTGLSVAAIVRANHLGDDAMIRIGQVLVLPGTKPAAAASAAATSAYTVRPGDTLGGIARAHKVSLATVLQLNRFADPDLIRAGQKLTLPAAEVSAAVTRTYPASVTRAAAANRAVLAKRSVPSRARMRQMVQRTAAVRGVDPALALAVAWQESGFDQRAVSPANAIGTMQVIPSTGVWASQLVGRTLDLLDPEDNVTAGVAVLASLLARAATEEQAIAGYYQGLASVRARGMYPDTKAYVASVKAHRKRFATDLARS